VPAKQANRKTGIPQTASISKDGQVLQSYIGFLGLLQATAGRDSMDIYMVGNLG